MIVFNNGTPNGLKGTTPIGGHNPPSSTLGANLAWKYAQKKLKKKKTSEVINNSIPHRNPSSTIALCKPCTAPSRLTSRHHWIITIPNKSRPMINKPIELRWNQEIIPLVKYNPPKDPYKGHGDSSTIWYGCWIKFDIFQESKAYLQSPKLIFFKLP